MLSGSLRRQPKGFIFPILVFTMTGIMFAVVTMVAMLVLRTNSTMVASSCSMRAYYAASAGLNEAAGSGVVGKYATNCARGQYLVPSSVGCALPGIANTVTVLDSDCSYSVQVADKSSGVLNVNAIGRCCGTNGAIVKINTNLNYAGDMPACPGFETVTWKGATYDTIWFNYDADGALDAGECWLKQNVYSDLPTGSRATQAGTASEVGLLYDATGAGDSNICPTGWAVSTDANWNALSAFLAANQGQKLKPAAADAVNQWQSSGYVGDGTAGFNAPGVGYYNGSHTDVGTKAHFRSSNGNDWILTYNTTSTSTAALNPTDSASVRCVK